jgi:hypothetical protein
LSERFQLVPQHQRYTVGSQSKESLPQVNGMPL